MSEERITRLEEAQAFADRTVETLDAEVRALGDKVDQMRRALIKLEARLEALEEGDDDVSA